MTENLATKRSSSSQVLDKFSKRMSAMRRSRLAFTLDATASRQRTWDLACGLQADMLDEAAKFGTLEIQLGYYRGDECQHFDWTTDGRELVDKMRRITCVGGYTQIGRILAHIRKEHAKQPISAVIFIGDAMEEDAGALIDAAAGLGVPLFMCQEGDDPEVKRVFSEMARVSKGIYEHFDAGAIDELRKWLRAIAVYAAGGKRALAASRDPASVKLLEQLK